MGESRSALKFHKGMNEGHAYCIEEISDENAVICIYQLTYVRPFDKQNSNESENMYTVTSFRKCFEIVVHSSE